MGGAPDADIVVGRLGQLVGLPGAEAAPEETHWAVRRLLEAIAADRPLTVVIEDVHWAEPAMLELIEHVTDRSRAPILLLCTARPELVERSPGWSEGRRNASTLALGPLSEADSEELVANLLDRIELPSAARQRILEAAEGNPLFVEHMVAMLVEGGVLRRDGDRWVVEGDLIDLSTPSSIGALIEARLERLPPEERTALERASIEGRRFHAGWVRALDTAAAPASAALDSLVGRDLIQPDRSAFAGDDGFRFRHILVRDAAYRRMAKRTRAELHERHAGWLEAVEGGRIAELDEIVGFHLEQAYQLRLELGPLDEAAAALAPRAAGHLIASGRRAAARGDVGASTRLLSRSAELLPAAHPDRASLLIDLAVELIDAGEFDLATATIAELSEADGIASDPSLDLAMRFAALRLESQIRPEGVAEKMEAEAQEAIPLLEALGDDRRLAQAWFLLGQVALFSADNAGQLDAWGRALDHAGRAGDAPVAAQAAVWCMLALVSGMTPAEDALRAIDEVVAKAPPSLDVGAWSKIMRGRCLAMLGDLERGRSLAREGRATFLELGRALTFGSSTMETSPIDEVAGDVDAAERELRDGYEQLVTLGDRAYLSTAAGRLARCVALRGDLVEAEELADVCEASSASDDLYSQVAWRQARALVLAQRTDADGALRLAHEAVALSRGSDDCLLRALALEDLAEVHRLSGRIAEAVGSLEGAMDLWQDKGAVAVVDRLRLRLAELTAP
jgi:tetratricopeptide (TPR) repeat protein